MHRHGLVRNVMSRTQVRSSSGSSNEIISWRSSAALTTRRPGGSAGPRCCTRWAMVPVRRRGPVWFDGGVSTTDEALRAALRSSLGDERVHATEVDLALHGRDASLLAGRPAAAVFPEDTAGVR